MMKWKAIGILDYNPPIQVSVVFDMESPWCKECKSDSCEHAKSCAGMEPGLYVLEPITDHTANLRKAVEEMMNSYRKEAKERKNDAYWRGAADACGNILDMPEMKLFLKEQVNEN